MQINCNVYPLHICAFLFTTAYSSTVPEEEDNFFAIAHGVNDANTAGWALGSGANAVEIDLNFDQETGQLTEFHHGSLLADGSPCDCSCRLDIFTAGTVCALPNPCSGGSPYLEHFNFLLTYDNLALVYIDSKTYGLSYNVQKLAGIAVVKEVESHLFEKGYKGKVLIGSQSEKEYLKSASTTAKESHFQSRIYFAYEKHEESFNSKIVYMKSLLYPNIIYTTGISSCIPKTFFEDISLASHNKAKGVVSNVFIWTIDILNSFELYYESGARGIITNSVPLLVEWARNKGYTLASPNDSSLKASISDRVISSLGDCSCEYYPGGCIISVAAPAYSACHCTYRGAWTCTGEVVGCMDPVSEFCSHPDTTIYSCAQGGGDCGAYSEQSCECEYNSKGCWVTKPAPAGLSCKCYYSFGWNCDATVVECKNEDSKYCNKPDTSIYSCIQGGGECDGYTEYSCDCEYQSGGCKISKPAPAYSACKCAYDRAWKCSGNVVSCENPVSTFCKTPDYSIYSCVEGTGDCGGYQGQKCECGYIWRNFLPSGCKITKPAPTDTACQCWYLGVWTCGGYVTHCRNTKSSYCASPDESMHSCWIGGGDCGGY
ncbi:unnamed protein product [Meganyctiphanes norvegica]|uniref:GP-PDE domain-containing protein n=1 Tax=Meganyctiphanes norvegica TaxID=48144 RepID=A0AAV2S6E5_MEGNR